MRRLLNFLYKLLGVLGAVLSLPRYWRTVTDKEEQREVRVWAGLALLLMCGLIAWSLVTGFGVAHRGARLLPVAEAAPPVDQIVVDFADQVPLADIDRWERDLGVDLHPNSPMAVAHKLMVADTGDLSTAQRERLLERIRRDPRVEAAGDNLRYSLLAVDQPVDTLAAASSRPLMEPNDPRYGEQWNFRLIHMPQAWERATGKGVVVAVIDTGCAFEREGDIPAASDLQQTKYTKPYDFVNKKKKAYDDHGHGTHVAGTIAQSTNNHHGVAGIAYNATIMPLKVLSKQGFGNVSDIADAINYAADNGANVINMSLGGPASHPVMRRACTYAHQKGVTIVCAAGNGGREGVGYPAAYPECIAVSSVGPSGELAFYSSYGKEVSLAAPGGEYRSAAEQENGVLQNTVFDKQDRFEHWQGTSMASPHVAGVAALLVELGVKGPETIRARLKATAQPKNDPLKYGAGILDAQAAVTGKRSDEPETAVVAQVQGRPIHIPQPVPAGPAVALLVLLAPLATRRRRALLAVAGLPVALGLAWVGSNVGNLGATALGCVVWPGLGALLLFGVKPLRPVLGGVLLGFAAGCGALALNHVGAGWWLVANALVALLLARLVSAPD